MEFAYDETPKLNGVPVVYDHGNYSMDLFSMQKRQPHARNEIWSHASVAGFQYAEIKEWVE